MKKLIFVLLFFSGCGVYHPGDSINPYLAHTQDKDDFITVIKNIIIPCCLDECSDPEWVEECVRIKTAAFMMQIEVNNTPGLQKRKY